MCSRHVFVLALATFLVLAPQWTVSVLAQPIDVVVSDREEIASDMDFVNAMKLLARQWSFASSTGDDAVLPAYRLDRLPEEHRALIVEGVLRSSEADQRVFLLRRWPTPEGDFVGRQVTIRTSSDGVDGVDEVTESPWDTLLYQGQQIRAGTTEGEPEEGVYLAMQEVEGLDPNTDVVFFGIAPTSPTGGPE